MEYGEPWRVEPYGGGCGYIHDKDGKDIHSGYYDHEMDPETARRIVACVCGLAQPIFPTC